MAIRYQTLCELRGRSVEGQGCSKEIMAWCALRTGENPGGAGHECSRSSLTYLDTIDPGSTPMKAEPYVSPYKSFPPSAAPLTYLGSQLTYLGMPLTFSGVI